MDSYILPIKVGIIIFPLIAFLFTMPYIIFLYRKYGSISIFRTLIVYSFILYLIITYFMVILPLPSISEVAKYTSDYMQLMPFKFISDFINNTSLVISNVHTYLSAIKEPYFYTVIFNIFILVPFGIYLRYYFKCSLKTTVFTSFLLSLFFELTQLTGLYFIYPRPYRLFDVDDLIINTLGGLIGYLITPIFSKILPSRETIDEKSYVKGQKVSYLRRFVALVIDLLCILIIYFTLQIYVNNIPFLFTLIILLYFIILPIIFRGRTIGKSVVRIKLETDTKDSPKLYQYFLRAFFSYGLFIVPSLIFVIFDLKFNGIQYLIDLIIIISFIIYYTYTLLCFIKRRTLPYEKISHIINVSDIKFEKETDEEPDIESIENED